MYQNIGIKQYKGMSEYRQMAGLGFSLKPPSWATAFIKKTTGALLKGTVLTVPTAGGTATFDLSDPKALASLKAMITGLRISRPTPDAAAPSGPAAVVDSIPGGWLTLGLAGVALFMFMKRRHA